MKGRLGKGPFPPNGPYMQDVHLIGYEFAVRREKNRVWPSELPQVKIIWACSESLSWSNTRILSRTIKILWRIKYTWKEEVKVNDGGREPVKPPGGYYLQGHTGDRNVGAEQAWWETCCTRASSEVATAWPQPVAVVREARLSVAMSWGSSKKVGNSDFLVKWPFFIDCFSGVSVALSEGTLSWKFIGLSWGSKGVGISGVHQSVQWCSSRPGLDKDVSKATLP